MESTSSVLSFRMVFFYLVTTGWIFDISLCENSIDQSLQQKLNGDKRERLVFSWFRQDWLPYPVDPLSLPTESYDCQDHRATRERPGQVKGRAELVIHINTVVAVHLNTSFYYYQGQAKPLF